MNIPEVKKINYEAKNWGFTSVVGRRNGVSVHKAIVSKGLSSIHLHERFDNVIISVDAILSISIFDESFDVKSRLLLKEDGTIEIPANVIHQFEVVKPGTILEIYYPISQDFDIVRFNV